MVDLDLPELPSESSSPKAAISAHRWRTGAETATQTAAAAA